jgi:crotonobetainyl-CoA:carnitine CoA-transferase CaiB-like acyl-CoA transferase
MEGFRPGVTKRLGIDYETVKKVNPQIIYCSITGYGQTGPYRDRVGHDANYLGIAGVLDLIGDHGKPPSIPGVQFADIAGGGMNGALGILLALYAREKTGKGQYIDISMTDAMAAFLPIAMFFRQITGKAPARSDNMLSHRYACYNSYETKDKKFLTICAVEHKFWKSLCELLEVSEYAPLQYDENRRLEIIDFMRNTFKQKTLEEWQSILGELDIAWGPVHNLEEAMQDEHLRHREMFTEFTNEHGNLTSTIGIPVKLSETPGSLRSQPPTFGKNTEEVLAELGYTKEEIQILVEENIV